MKTLHMVTFTLLAIGGLNWLATAFNYNLVEKIFGAGTIAMVIYILVGLSAIFEIFTHKNCRSCSADKMDGAKSM